MDFKLIEQAVVLGEVGNFARAAERLGVSQPTLSRNIAALEASLGTPLFDRGRKGSVPTVFGRVLLQRGAALVGDAAALRAELGALAGLKSGTLQIVAGPYVGEELVGPAIARLVNERPGLTVRATLRSPDEICPEMLTGRYDLGFGALDSPTGNDQLSVELLQSRQLFFGCRPAHPLIGSRPTLAQLRRFPLVTTVLHGRQAPVSAVAGRAGRVSAHRKGFVPSIEVNSIEVARQVAAGSDALFPGTELMLDAAVTEGRLAVLDFEHPELRDDYALVRLRHRSLSPAAQRFMELIMGLVAERAEPKPKRRPLAA